ncbi:hypothetical protein [Chromobacterium phragmitis]|uniref:Uncharacterized protein n=1 Tax=Chromobacterium phragmitis TaxID=2202141 RepID=A0ABV0ISV5_9NEIS
MTDKIIIIKSNGEPTTAMDQPQAEEYLGNPKLITRNRLANLKQALNDVTSGKGKATGTYRFNGHPVLHASSGNGEKSVSLFFYDENGDHYIIAMGEHVSSTSYTLSDYGQPDGPFRENATIAL